MEHTHVLKTDPDLFDLVVEGLKTFDIRKNDRDFQPGDLLTLAKTVHTGEEMAHGAALEYTGDNWTVRVLYVLSGPAYGLKDGFCAMSIARPEFPDKQGQTR